MYTYKRIIYGHKCIRLYVYMYMHVLNWCEQQAVREASYCKMRDFAFLQNAPISIHFGVYIYIISKIRTH